MLVRTLLVSSDRNVTRINLRRNWMAHKIEKSKDRFRHDWIQMHNIRNQYFSISYCFPPVGFIFCLAGSSHTCSGGQTLASCFMLTSFQLSSLNNKKKSNSLGAQHKPQKQLSLVSWGHVFIPVPICGTRRSSDLIGLAWVTCSDLDLEHDVSPSEHRA